MDVHEIKIKVEPNGRVFEATRDGCYAGRWSKEFLDAVLGTVEPGTYRVHLERVTPKAARITGDDNAFFCAKCGGYHCSRSQEKPCCLYCGVVLGEKVMWTEVRDKDGKSLITEG